MDPKKQFLAQMIEGALEAEIITLSGKRISASGTPSQQVGNQCPHNGQEGTGHAEAVELMQIGTESVSEQRCDLGTCEEANNCEREDEPDEAEENLISARLHEQDRAHPYAQELLGLLAELEPVGQ